jgi:hypothetical protein
VQPATLDKNIISVVSILASLLMNNKLRWKWLWRTFGNISDLPWGAVENLEIILMLFGLGGNILVQEECCCSKTTFLKRFFSYSCVYSHDTFTYPSIENEDRCLPEGNLMEFLRTD